MSGQFRWGDLLDHDTTDREAAYLGTTSDDDDQRVHYWDDGTTLPVLSGSAGDGTDTDDDAVDDEDLDADSGGDDDEDEQDDSRRPTPKPSSQNRAHRQAARFRIDAKTERARAESAEARAVSAEVRERDLRIEIAFTRAAGSRFSDGDAAWKLVDKSLLILGEDGTVTGTDAAIAKLTDAYPFLTQTDDDSDNNDDDDGRPGKDRNPFITSSGTPMAGKRAANQRIAGDHTSAAVLAKKYPALGGR